MLVEILIRKIRTIGLVTLACVIIVVLATDSLYADVKVYSQNGNDIENFMPVDNLDTTRYGVIALPEVKIPNLKFSDFSMDDTSEYWGLEEDITGTIEKIDPNVMQLLVAVNGMEQVVPISSKGTFKCSLKYEKGINFVSFNYDGRWITFERNVLIRYYGTLGVSIDNETQTPSKFLEVNLSSSFINSIQADLRSVKLTALERQNDSGQFSPQMLGTFPIKRIGNRYFATTDIPTLDFPLEGPNRRYVVEVFDAEGRLKGHCKLTMPLVIQIQKKDQSTLTFYSPFIAANRVGFEVYDGLNSKAWRIKTLKDSQLYELPSALFPLNVTSVCFRLEDVSDEYSESVSQIKHPKSYNDQDDTGSFEVTIPFSQDSKLGPTVSGSIKDADFDKDWVDVYLNGIHQKIYLDPYGNFRAQIKLKQGVNIVGVTYKHFSEGKLVMMGRQQEVVIKPQPTENLAAPIYDVPLRIPNLKVLRGKSGLTLKLTTSRAMSAQGPVVVDTIGTYKLIGERNSFVTAKKINLEDLGSRNHDFCEALVYDSKGKLLIRFFVNYIR